MSRSFRIDRDEYVTNINVSQVATINELNLLGQISYQEIDVSGTGPVTCKSPNVPVPETFIWAKSPNPVTCKSPNVPVPETFIWAKSPNPVTCKSPNVPVPETFIWAKSPNPVTCKSPNV